MLGVDLDGEDCDDRILGPKKPKGDKVALKSYSEYKFEDEEELPACQDQPAIPEMHVDINRSDSGRSSGGSGRSSKSGSRNSSSSCNSSNYLRLSMFYCFGNKLVCPKIWRS